MSDLVTKLREPVTTFTGKMRDYPDGRTEGPFHPLMLEAADLIESLEKENAELRSERDHYAKGEMAAVEKGQEHFHRANAAEEALEKIIDRSHNGELGTSKVIDIRTIAQRALTMEDIHREQLDRPRLKPAEAGGREG